MWLELINNKAVADDAVFVAPNGEKVTMGQVREAYVAERGAVAAQQREMRRAQEEIANVYTIMKQEETNLEVGREQLRREREALVASNPAAAPGDDAVNELLSPAMRRIDQLEAAIAERDKRIESVNKSLAEAMTSYMNDVWERQIAGFKEEIPEGVSKKDLIKFALDNGMKSKNGIPDVGKALERLTEPKRMEKQLKDAEDRGAQRAREEMAMASLGQVSGFSIVQPSDGGNGAPKSFGNMDAAFAAAAKDASVFMGGKE